MFEKVEVKYLKKTLLYLSLMLGVIIWLTRRPEPGDDLWFNQAMREIKVWYKVSFQKKLYFIFILLAWCWLVWRIGWIFPLFDTIFLVM